MQTRSLCLAAAVLAALTALPARTQPPKAGAAPPAMPIPTPGPELGQVGSFFAGDWSCKGQADASPFGPAHATQGKVHVRKDFGGFWYVGRYDEAKTAANPHPMSFEFVMGYGAAGKTWTMDGFDVFGDRSHETSPGWQADKLVYEGQSAGNGPAIPVRDTFTKKSAASLEHEGEMQVGGKWVHLDQETCTKTQK
jgi:hypothetical protein